MAVMSSKLGVNAFGATQTKPMSSNATQAQLTDGDLKKLGAENVGDLLNKVSDPNWVDPSKKMRTVGNDKLDKDAFFKLMLAQMKNQDPTNPLKSHEMAAQLASFSSLEQMQNMNTTLTDLKNGQKPTEQFQVLNLLGKAVAGDSSRVHRAQGDKNHEFVFNLPAKAKEAEIRVRNADGEEIKTYKLANLKEGENRLPWNGQDEKGNTVPAGEYQFFIEAKNEQGTKMAIKTEFEGMISGVNYTPEGPVLLIGNQAIRLKDVKKIVDPSLLSAPTGAKEIDVAASTAEALDEKMKAAGLPSTKATDVGTANKVTTKAADQNKDVQGAPAAPPKSKILDQVGLSNEMMAKLAKETN
ncbi:MAG: DUF2271 domain-containing protein [Bdellovibrionaceae bacterium]|nr:DUF2271 domain-containing protein [Pseudobdellovibrionaceae bacterium]